MPCWELEHEHEFMAYPDQLGSTPEGNGTRRTLLKCAMACLWRCEWNATRPLSTAASRADIDGPSVDISKRVVTSKGIF